MLPDALRAQSNIDLGGRLSATLRLVQPADGADSVYQAYTGELNAGGFLWQPWFGLWRARGAISLINNDERQKTESTVLTGDADMRLFHRSKFPFNAYGSIQESTLDIQSDLARSSEDIRLIRIGATQQYQDTANNGFYSALLQRDYLLNRSRNTENEQTRLQLSADRQQATQRLGAVYSLTQTSSNVANAESLDQQLNLFYGVKPNESLSVDTTFSGRLGDASSDFDEISAQSLSLSTQALWRDTRRPLTVRGEAAVTSDRFDSDVSGSRPLDTLRLRGGARYHFTPNLSIAADLGLDHRRSDSDRTSSFQALSGTYRSPGRNLGSFVYNWNAGAGLGHEQTSGFGSNFVQSGNLGHAVNRSWILPSSATKVLAFNAGQDLNVRAESRGDDQVQLLNRAQLVFSSTGAGRVTTAQMSIFDLLSFGRIDTHLLTLNAVVNHTQTLDRYRQFDLAGSLNATRTDTDVGTTSSEASSLEVRYRDGRLFGVRRLLFESRLRALSSTLFFYDAASERGELEWDNRLNYQIGKLEVNGRVTYSGIGNDLTSIYSLNLSRRF